MMRVGSAACVAVLRCAVFELALRKNGVVVLFFNDFKGLQECVTSSQNRSQYSLMISSICTIVVYFSLF